MAGPSFFEVRAKNRTVTTARFRKRALQLFVFSLFNFQCSTFDSAKVRGPFPVIELEKE